MQSTNQAKPPRVSLWIFAHGSDIFHGTTIGADMAAVAQEFALPRNHITILNCGTGTCGSTTMVTKPLAKTMRQIVATNTSPNRPDTMRNMLRTQSAAKREYTDFTKMAAAQTHDEMWVKAWGHVKDAVAADYCKIYHPHLDRIYGLQQSAAEAAIEKWDLTIEIVEVFDAHPATNVSQLRGSQLNSQRVLQYIMDDPNITPSDKRIVLQVYARWVKRHEIHLGDIVAMMSLLGFQYVNVYEFACRVIVPRDAASMAATAGLTSADIEVFNRREELSAARKTQRFGGLRRTRRRRRRSRCM